MSGRPETGVMRFKDDFPGVFIRGDNALYLGLVLDNLLQDKDLLPIDAAVLGGLRNLLTSCDVRSGCTDIQELKLFDECQK